MLGQWLRGLPVVKSDEFSRLLERKTESTLTKKAGQNLYRLNGHHCPDDPRDAAENALILTCSTPGEPSGDLGPYTAVARAVLAEVVHRQLAVEAKSSTRDERLAKKDAGVRNEVSCEREVGTIEDKGIGAKDLDRVLSREGGRVGGDTNSRVVSEIKAVGQPS